MAGNSSNARKRHSLAIFSAVIANKRPPLSCIMSFSDDDLRHDISYPHDDPLVVVLEINQVLIKRTLVNSGAQVNLITLNRVLILPIRFPFTGFSQMEEVTAKGVFQLGVHLGSTDGPSRNLIAEFTVVDVPMAYNAIMGRSILNEDQVVISTHHLMLKLPTEDGTVGEMRGD